MGGQGPSSSAPASEDGHPPALAAVNGEPLALTVREGHPVMLTGRDLADMTPAELARHYKVRRYSFSGWLAGWLAHVVRQDLLLPQALCGCDARPASCLTNQCLPGCPCQTIS